MADFSANWHTGRWLVSNAARISVVSQAYPWLIVFYGRHKQRSHLWGIPGACVGDLPSDERHERIHPAAHVSRLPAGWTEASNVPAVAINRWVMSLPFLVWTVSVTAFADVLISALYSSKYTGHTTLIFLLLNEKPG